MAANPTSTPAAEVEPLPEALLAQFKPILDSIPWDEDDDGTGILTRMLEAQTWEDLNVLGNLPSLESLSPCRLKVLKIAKRESDLGGRMPVYLLVDAVNPDSGEMVKFNTSAGQPFLAMAMLHHMGNLPALIEVKPSDKPTRRGYRPLNLTVLAADGTAKRG